MLGAPLSIRELTQSAGYLTTPSFKLRQTLGILKGSIRLSPRKFSFSLITYNMALIVAPGSYKGTQRRGVIKELIRQINLTRADIVGLCEVFDNDEREYIQRKCFETHPYYREGPDEDDFESDGGLLLMSKHPIISFHQSIYRQCAGDDCWANKGVIHIRVRAEQWPMPIDVFFSHAQDFGRIGEYREELYAQLIQLGYFVQAHGAPHTPTFIFGDLNIPASGKQAYNQLLQRLGKPMDAWPTKYPSNKGHTNIRENNFYENPKEDGPRINNRLDYVLMKVGLTLIPGLKDIQILKWAHRGRQISDHFGLHAQFEKLVEISVNLSEKISRIEAVIRGVRCIETTSGAGTDEVSFSLMLSNNHRRSQESATSFLEDMDTGSYNQNINMKSVSLKGDPGKYITIVVWGIEHDTIGSDEFYLRSLKISRDDLLLNKERHFTRVMPFLTNGTGLYAIEVQITVT